MERKKIFLAVFIIFFVSNIGYAVTASFQGLGDLPGGGFWSEAWDVSADGRNRIILISDAN